MAGMIDKGSLIKSSGMCAPQPKKKTDEEKSHELESFGSSDEHVGQQKPLLLILRLVFDLVQNMSEPAAMGFGLTELPVSACSYWANLRPFQFT